MSNNVFQNLEMLNKVAAGLSNIPGCIKFLLVSEPHLIEWMVERWKASKILRIIGWKAVSRYEWALHINLEEVGRPGQEAIIPFEWAEEHVPSIEEGIFAWRLCANGE